MLGSITRALNQIGLGPLYDALRDVGIALGAIAGQPGKPIVYRPSAPPGVGGYTDWNALYAAMPEFAPVIIDDTYQSPAPIPAGVWSKVTVLSGPLDRRSPPAPPGNVNVIATCEDGCKLPGLSQVMNVLTLRSLSSTSVRTLGDGEVVIIERGAGVENGPGTAPMIVVPAGIGNQAVMVAFLGGTIGSSPAQPVVDIGLAGSGLVVFLGEIGNLADGSITGGTLGVIALAESAFFGTPSPPSQTASPFQVLNLSSSKNLVDWCATDLAAFVGTTYLQAAGTSTTQVSGIRMLRPSTFSFLVVSHDSIGGNPALSTVRYELFVGASSIAFVDLDANAPDVKFATFLAGVTGGSDFITLRATPSAPLVNSPTAIFGNVAL